jgi:putative membrane protein insertion efficiency factor
MIMLWNSQKGYSQSLNSTLVSTDTIAETKKTFVFLQGSTKDGMGSVKSLFSFYKRYISSQDGQSCRFTPSCSEYAFLSIKKHGFMMGLLDFFDRFSRCNPLSPENYELHADRQSFLDPVE